MTCHMTLENYYSARNSAVKRIAAGLVFLLFLPVGIPLSLIIIPFLAGRYGTKELPRDWHTTFVITVGGGCSLGFVFLLYFILSFSLGPALRIGITEPIILGMIVTLIWGSFFLGARNSTGIKSEIQLNEDEWDREEGMAIPEEVKSKEIRVKEAAKPEKDVKDKLADLKREFKKTKKRSAKIGALEEKR